jgi:hypothetical protein
MKDLDHGRVGAEGGQGGQIPQGEGIHQDGGASRVGHLHQAHLLREAVQAVGFRVHRDDLPPRQVGRQNPELLGGPDPLGSGCERLACLSGFGHPGLRNGVPLDRHEQAEGGAADYLMASLPFASENPSHGRPVHPYCKSLIDQPAPGWTLRCPPGSSDGR